MKRACSRCRKEHRACKGGVPCRRCVALGSPDDIKHRKKQEGRCSRQATSHSITTPAKQKPELGGQEQTCPQFKKPHPCVTRGCCTPSKNPSGARQSPKNPANMRIFFTYPRGTSTGTHEVPMLEPKRQWPGCHQPTALQWIAGKSR